MSRAGGIASWQGVQEEVLRRINARIWKPGDPIPNEVDLAAEFGCARATVNRALRELAETGLLERRRKAGTRVALHPVRKAILDIPIIRLEIEGRGHAYGYRLLRTARRPASAAGGAALGMRPGQPTLRIEALHLADGRPFVHEDRWVNLAAVPQIATADLSAISANEWLVRHAPFTRGDFGFEAANADRRIAGLLDTHESAALLIATRTTWNGDQTVTTVRLSFAPGYRMHTTI